MQALIESEINHLVDANKMIVISNNDDLGRAISCIKGIKGLIEKVKESYDPIVDQAHKAHKEAISQRDKYLKPLQETEKKFKDAILVFNKKVAFEQMEIERIANERLAKAAEERRQELLQKSQKTDDAWDKESLEEKAKSIIPVTVDHQKKAIHQEGLSIRKTWKARVIDINLIPREYLLIEANMSTLNQYAREHRNLKHMSGVEFYEESSTSFKS